MVDLILKKYDTQHKSRDALLFEARQIEQIMLPTVYPIGSIDPQRIQMIADSFVQAGFVKNAKKMDPEEFIYKYKQTPFNHTDEERAYIRDKKEIRMCIDPNWMPFEAFDKGGKHIGMTADFFKIFS